MDLGLPVLDREFFDGGENPHTGIVHQHVQATKSIRGLLDKATAVFWIGHVSGDTEHAPEERVIQILRYMLHVG
jgi:hypothetical protein